MKKTTAFSTIPLAWRLAKDQLLAMKLRTMAAVLIIAAPLSFAWASSFTGVDRIDHGRAEQVIRFGDFGTRFDAQGRTKLSFDQLDSHVQSNSANKAVPVIRNSVRESYQEQCTTCLGQIAWIPSQDSLGGNSQLISGTWPKDSTEVLVADWAVAQGAPTKGKITITHHETPDVTDTDGQGVAEQYTVVGVARTVVGFGKTTYTSVLDDRIRHSVDIKGTNRQYTWFIPGPTLNQNQVDKISSEDLVPSLPGRPAAYGSWALQSMPYLFLTGLAIMVVSGVFLRGFGRMRQSVNTILQNGGSKWTAMILAGMQGAIIAFLVVAVIGAAGALGLIVGQAKPLPEGYPLNADVLQIPWRGMLAYLAATFGLVVTASVIPAVGLRQSQVVEQQKSYSAQDAERDLAPARLGWFTRCGLAFNVVLWPILLVCVFRNVKIPGLRSETSYMLLTGAALVLLTTGVLTAIPFFTWVTSKMRDALWQRDKLDPGVRISLSTGSGLIAATASIVLVAQAALVGHANLASAVQSSGGYITEPINPAQEKSATEIVESLRSSGDFRGVEFFVANRPGDKPSSDSDTNRREARLFSGQCPIDVGKKLDIRGVSACTQQSRLAGRVFVMPATELENVFRLSTAETTHLKSQGALLIGRGHEWETLKKPENLLLAVSTASTSTDEHPIIESRLQLAIQSRTGGFLPGTGDGIRVLIAQEMLQAGSIPSFGTRVLARNRLGMNDGQRRNFRAAASGTPAEPASPATAQAQRFLALAAAFLGLILAVGSAGAAGRVRAMRDLGARFGRRLKVTVQHCFLAGLITSVAGTIFGVLSGLLVGATSIATHPVNYLSWDQPRWGLLWVPFLLPLFAVVFAVPMTWLWSHSTIKASVAGAQRYTAIGTILAAIFIGGVFVWMSMLAGGPVE